MSGQYGPYVMYALSRLLQKNQESMSENALPEEKRAAGDGKEAGCGGNDPDIFGSDETGAIWHRETDLEILGMFCREGYAQALKHGHYIIGKRDEEGFIGIPGRFLLEDQPAGGRTGFTLWQPLRGGEHLYSSLEEMDSETAVNIYGYWIAALDKTSLQISEV